MILKQRNLKKLEDEIWRVHPNSNNRYHVSNYGRVKSFYYDKIDGKILKFHEVKGFKTVHLRLNKKSQTYYVHKIIAEVWIPKPSEDYSFVTHLDGNIKNNHISNLEWMNKEKLMVHHRELRKTLNKPRRRGVICNSKLKEKDVMLLKSMLHRGVTQAKIANMFCISEMQVTRIKRGENWGHVHFEGK
jgi:DNA-directed RNA polymerase specialized sigma subunit